MLSTISCAELFRNKRLVSFFSGAAVALKHELGIKSHWLIALRPFKYGRSSIEHKPMPPLDDETRYCILKLLESKPELSHRELANEMGVSLGKVNYCLRAVMERGLVKVKYNTHKPNKHNNGYNL